VPELAVNCYVHVAESRPTDARVWYRLACALALTGDVARALASLDRTQTYEAKNVPLYWRRGEYLLEVGEVEKARVAFDAALKIDRTDRAARAGLARCQLRQGEVEPAIVILERLVQNRDDLYCQRLLGAAYAQAGRDQEALVQMHLSGESRPLWSDPWTEAMAVHRTGISPTLLTVEDLYKAGEFAQGLRILEPMAEVYPANSAVQYALGIGYGQVGRIDDAMRQFERAMELQSNWALPPSGLAAVYESRGNHEQALQWIDRAIALNPRLGSLHVQRAQVLAKLGRLNESLDEFEQAFTLEPGNVQPLVSKGRVQIKRGDLMRARETFERAVAHNPASAAAQAGLAETYLELGQFANATAALQQARRINAAEPGLDDLQRRIERSQ
jgi:tetratricopeptide (TPR) repeat protein